MIEHWDYITRWWQVGFWFLMAVVYLIASIGGADLWRECLLVAGIFLYALQWALLVQEPEEE